MVCREWQRKIPDFLDDRMPVEELMDFISHVQSCRDCYEELEIMFILSVGIKELDKDTDESGISYNFKKMLEEKLKKARAQYERFRSFQKMKSLVLGTMYLVTAAGILVQILFWMR